MGLLQFKAILDNGFKSIFSNQIVVEPFDLAMLCEQSLNSPEMKKAIVSSWKSVGIFPYDENVIL
jgi:hypothetical protein